MASAGGHLAVIPARGGSKRLPRKNVIDFLGRPIIAYTIDAAVGAGVFDRVLVSTEDEEIARIVRDLGGEVDRRPAELGGDEVGVAAVCRELVGRLAAAGDTYETLSVLYATAPLRTAEDVRSTWSLLQPGICDYAMAVTEFSQPVHQALTEADDGRLESVFPELVTRRRSDVRRYLAGNGSTYCVSLDSFLETGSFYGPGLRGHVMPAARSIDIDTREDYELALFRASHLWPCSQPRSGA
jgi:CMP-N-acetylneuraminic acid synthetase